MLTVGPQFCSTPGSCAGGHGAGNTHTFTKGNIYFAMVASGGFPPFSVAGGGNLFTLVSQVTTGSTNYLGLYVYAPTTTHTGAFWFEYSPNGSCWDYGKGWEVSGVPNGTNGTVAIRQIVTGSGTSANPSITMAPLNPANAVFAAFVNSSATFSGTPESPFSQLWDEGCSSYPGATYGMTNINGSDNTPSFTAASSTWAGIAVEFRANRLITLIN